jgi:cytoskeletal protein CcmA (bactofilin family)
MASTYVNNLRLNEMGTGDASGTWGTTTNTNLELIGEALGFGTEAITTNADTHTTTVADGSSDAGRAMFLKYTGTLDSACTITIAPNTMKRMQFIENGTSGSQNIIISQGSGANITIPAGDTKAVYLDGAGSGAAVVDAFASLNVVDLKVQDDLTVTDDLTVNGDIDLEGAIDVNGTANLDVVDIDGAVNIAAATTVATDNKIQFRDTAIYINSSADGQLDLVADTEIQIAATTIDIDGAINASGEIIAASLDISGNVDVDGTLETDALSIASTTITATAAELNYSDGVTSNIQTQLDTKATTGKAIAMALVFG